MIYYKVYENMRSDMKISRTQDTGSGIKEVSSVVILVL